MLPFKQLKDIEQLRKISGVYFLCWNNEVVYVGQSVNVIARIGQHLSGFLSRYKGEIGAYFLECDEGLLGLVERHYILFFMPCENRFIPSGCDEKHIEYYNNKRMIKAHEYKLQRKKGIDKRSGMPKMETDDKAVNDELLDWLIVDWKNIKNPQTGSDVPCTKENKLKLPSSIKAALIERADSESTQNDADENVFESGDSKIFYRRFDSEVFYKIQKKWTTKKFEDEIIERYEKRKRKAAQRKKRKIKTAEQLREEGKLIFLYKEQEVMIND